MLPTLIISEFIREFEIALSRKDRIFEILFQIFHNRNFERFFICRVGNTASGYGGHYPTV